MTTQTCQIGIATFVRERRSGDDATDTIPEIKPRKCFMCQRRRIDLKAFERKPVCQRCFGKLIAFCDDENHLSRRAAEVERKKNRRESKAKRKLKPEIQKRAKENQSSLVKKNSSEPLNTQDELAKEAGLSHDTFRKGEYILDNADEETSQDDRITT